MQKSIEKEPKIINPTVFEDERGFFFESFNSINFEKEIGYKVDFVQDNHSKSTKGVLRGLHYQLAPYSQGKLVRVISGEVFDIAVDIRKSSRNFSKWIGVNLSEKNKKQIWIPEGFAHGLLVISEEAEVLYKTTNFYNKDFQRSIKWDDKDLNITWPLEESPILSSKDNGALSLKNSEVFE